MDSIPIPNKNIIFYYSRFESASALFTDSSFVLNSTLNKLMNCTIMSDFIRTQSESNSPLYHVPVPAEIVPLALAAK